MRYLSIGLLLAITACAATISAEDSVSESVSHHTTFYLVRHAEKEKSESKDPQLTAKGRARAQNFAEFLSNEKVDAVYSTDTIRTRDTAAPVANSQNVEVTLYSPRDLDYHKFLHDNQGKTVVVVGHSNTTPAFTNGLIRQQKYQDLDESQYDTLFVVDIIQGVAKAKTLQLKMTDQPKNSEAAMPAKPAHEKINYLEYPAKDIEATKAFFSKAFAWEFVDYGPDYAAFSNQGTDGGFYRADLSSKSEQGAALTVLYSDALEKTLDKVKAAGGVIIKPIFSFPGGRRFHFSEPSGNEFAVWGE